MGQTPRAYYLWALASMHMLVNEKLVFYVQYLPLVLGKRSSKCQNPHLPMALIMEILLALVNACLAPKDNENHLTRIGLFLGFVADLQPLLSNAKGVSISMFVAQHLSKRKFVAQELTIAFIITPKENDCFSSKLQSWLIKFVLIAF